VTELLARLHAVSGHVDHVELGVVLEADRDDVRRPVGADRRHARKAALAG